MPGHAKCCTCHAKIILANLQIWCSKMQPLSGNERPDLLTSLMNMSFVLRLPRKMHLCRSSSNVPRLPSFLEMRRNPHVLLTFDKVHNPLRLPRETSSECPKSGPNVVCFVHFDFEMCFAPQRCALFDISTSKSGPKLVCFVHFDLEMCFAPQWRALFDIATSKVVWEWCFFTFWLRNVLRATTACTFLTSQRPKVVRAWCALYILTWKCGSFLIAVNYIQRFITNRKGAVLFASDKVISLRAFTNVARFLWSLFSVSITLTKCCMQPHKSAFRWRWWTCCALVVLNSVCSWWKIKCDRLLCVNPGCIP